jgi:type I restriction enzyme R subunit
VVAHYVSEGVQELEQDKLTSLLRLKYNTTRSADAVADLGRPEEIGEVFTDCRQCLYQGVA